MITYSLFVLEQLRKPLKVHMKDGTIFMYNPLNGWTQLPSGTKSAPPSDDRIAYQQVEMPCIDFMTFKEI